MMAEPVKCRGCGATIYFGRTPQGKTVPLDPRPPVYRVHAGTRPLEIERVTDCYVSHFATCPKAGDFSASRRRAEQLRGHLERDDYPPPVCSQCGGDARTCPCDHLTGRPK